MQSVPAQTIAVNFTPVYIAYTLAWCCVLFRARHRIVCVRQLGALFFLMLHAGIILYFTFEPFVFTLGRSHWNANLIPVIESWKMLTQGILSIALYNLVGNVLLFMPFGAILPAAFSNMRSWWRVGVSTALTSLSIETLQLLFAVRLFDIDDIILNAIGGMFGYLLWRCARQKTSVVHRIKSTRSLRGAQKRAVQRHSQFTQVQPVQARESLSLTFTGIVTFAAYIGLVIGVVFALAFSRSL
ncbi:Predicted integral membrane protein [Chlamydia trachomatis]|nr:Predicted integral membrane protein [Chlamydia trachomatis]